MSTEVAKAKLSGDDPVVRQLMQQAQLVSRLRRDLDALAHEATDFVAELVGRVEELESGQQAPGRTPTSWCWRGIGQRGADELWHQLAEWVEWIRSRYPLARKLPPCWAEHPELVEELTALYLAWQHAYEDRGAPLTAAADWHDRWLPGVLNRLEHGPFALDCTNEHRARPITAYATPNEESEIDP